MTGIVSVSLSKVGKAVKLSHAEQDAMKGGNVVEQAALKAAGITRWSASKSGVVFKSEEGSFVSCSPFGGQADDKAHQVKFKCKKAKASMRFAAEDPETWKSCGADAVPYGWKEDWGEFNHPFFAWTKNGFYGCDTLTTDGYCMDPFYYGYTAYDPAVLSSPKQYEIKPDSL